MEPQHIQQRHPLPQLHTRTWCPCHSQLMVEWQQQQQVEAGGEGKAKEPAPHLPAGLARTSECFPAEGGKPPGSCQQLHAGQSAAC
jgi:hypothetical protein